MGGESNEVDQRGALYAILHQPLGRVMVACMAVGFAGYALWRWSEAAFGVKGDRGSRFARVQSGFRGTVYAFFCVTTVAILFGSHGTQRDQQEGLTAEVLEHTGGRLLVGIVAVGVIVTGLALAVEGFTRKFMRYFPAGQLDARRRTLVMVLGAVGNTARGLVFALAGGLLLVGAWNYDADQASGIDGAVRLLHDNGANAVLVAAAAGLIAFGCYGLLEAAYRRV